MPADAATGLEGIKQRVVDLLRTIYDPEIPVNIYDLGLIYGIDLKEEHKMWHVSITMTLTSPGCPVAESLLEQVRSIRYRIDDLKAVEVDLVFDPPWSMEKLSEAAKLQMGIL